MSKKNDLRTFDNIHKITTCQGDYYTIGCLLGYPYFKEHYKVIATDLSKQQALDGKKKVNFTENLDQTGSTIMFFFTEDAKGTILDFSEGTDNVVNLVCFNIISI